MQDARACNLIVSLSSLFFFLLVLHCKRVRRVNLWYVCGMDFPYRCVACNARLHFLEVQLRVWDAGYACMRVSPLLPTFFFYINTLLGCRHTLRANYEESFWIWNTLMASQYICLLKKMISHFAYNAISVHLDFDLKNFYEKRRKVFYCVMFQPSMFTDISDYNI